MNAPFKNLIAGEWAGSQNASRNINPSNTNDVVGEYSQGSVEDLNNAVAAAKAAFPAWSRTTPQERYEILKKASDEIPARTSLAACCSARKARPCRKASARPPAPARSSPSSPASACA